MIIKSEILGWYTTILIMIYARPDILIVTLTGL